MNGGFRLLLGPSVGICDHRFRSGVLLLDNVGEFVGDQSLALGTVGSVTSVRKCNVPPDRKRGRPKGSCAGGRVRSGMHPDSAQLAAEATFHERAGGRVKRLADREPAHQPGDGEVARAALKGGDDAACGPRLQRRTLLRTQADRQRLEVLLQLNSHQMTPTKSYADI